MEPSQEEGREGRVKIGIPPPPLPPEGAVRKALLFVVLTVNLFWLSQVQGQDKGIVIEAATPGWSSQLAAC